MAVLIREDLGGEGIALGIGEDLASSLDKYLQRKTGASFHLDSCWYCTYRFRLFSGPFSRRKRTIKRRREKKLTFRILAPSRTMYGECMHLFPETPQTFRTVPLPIRYETSKHSPRKQQNIAINRDNTR